MGIRHIVLICDNKVRPDTTGIYCRRALRELVDVHHYLPSEVERIPRAGFDLYLVVDDGLRNPIPDNLSPVAYWAIDTHLDFDWALSQARRADFVFAAQKDGAERLRAEGISSAKWLPLACDPQFHRKHEVAKEFDICFVGHLFPGARTELVRQIQATLPNTYVGCQFFDAMARTYSASRMVFNRSLKNDVNMRVFEGLSCGSLLLTNDLTENGQADLFQDGVHCAIYRTAEEMLDKARFYLSRESLRESIARTGSAEAHAEHTYGHRMRSVLRLIDKSLSTRSAVIGGLSEPIIGVKSTVATREFGLTSIVVVTHNQWQYTHACLESVCERTDVPYELILVDNGSTDGTVEHLASIAGAKIISNGENRGFPAAANQGIMAARGEYILLLNNDTIVTTGWLRRMLDVLEREADVGVVGPSSNRCSGPQEVAVGYDRLDSLDGFAWDWGKMHDRQTVPTDRLVGFCLLFRRTVVDRIGLLDERFGIGNFEDDDFCRRAINSGFQAKIAVDSFVHHFGGRTFFGSGVDFAGLLEENRQKYEAKWNGNGQSTTGHFSESLSAMPATTPVIPSSIPHSKLRTPNSPPRFSIKSSPHGGLLLVPNSVTLSLCMIVRDNESTIGPCLESIRPYVDEIVIVDTGSKDRTPDICREYGARLFEFPWCDDFSAARNESLRHARGEWLFWMDSDDTIPAECGEKLRALANGPHVENILGYVMQVHCPGPGDGDHLDVTVVDHVKLIRNRPELRFEGRIHEQLLPAIRQANGDVAWTDLYVVHSGSDHSAEGWNRKLERDLRILHQELNEKPDHPFVLFNLGMTYADAKRFDEAIGFLEQCLRFSRPEESHLRKAFALLVSSLALANRHDAAWTTCQKGRELFPDDKELLFRSAMLHQHYGRFRDAERAYLDVLNGVEERHFTSIDQGLAGYKARQNLAVVYEEMGCLDKAEAEWRQVTHEVPAYASGWRGLGEILIRRGDFDGLEREVAQLLRREGALHREGVFLNGRLAAAQGNMQAAVSNFERADQLASSESEALRWLCHCQFQANDLDAAERNLLRLTELTPDDGAAFHNLGTVQSRQSRPYDAIRSYWQSVALRPDSLDTWMQLGWALREAGRTQEAIPVWNEVLRRAPGHPQAVAALKASVPLGTAVESTATSGP